MAQMPRHTEQQQYQQQYQQQQYQQPEFAQKKQKKLKKPQRALQQSYDNKKVGTSNNYAMPNGFFRYTLHKPLASTLQGTIYTAVDEYQTSQRQNGDGGKKWVVVKEWWKKLVRQNRSRTNEKIQENCFKEMVIHQDLTELAKKLKQRYPDKPIGYTLCHHVWADDKSYYMATEYCGKGLFEYVEEVHAAAALKNYKIKQRKKLQVPLRRPNEWILVVADIFQQMCETVDLFHSNGIAHRDISLENTMVVGFDKPTGFCNVKIIDFGLAVRFGLGSQKRRGCGLVGKTRYMAPEVLARNYDVCQADVWSLGVSLFHMIFCVHLYHHAAMFDEAFALVINGQLEEILKSWKLLSQITPEGLDLLNAIFKPENKRISIRDILSHPFLVNTRGYQRQRIQAQVQAQSPTREPKMVEGEDDIKEYNEYGEGGYVTQSTKTYQYF